MPEKYRAQATVRRATDEETAEGRRQLLRPRFYRFRVTFPKGQVRWVRDSDPYPQLVVNEQGASEHEESLKDNSVSASRRFRHSDHPTTLRTREVT